MPQAASFPIPKHWRSAEMLREDLEAAGVPYEDESGRKADFHSLRHTFITNLANAKVHPKTAQRLARHSTITLTLDRYTHSLWQDEVAALEALPDLILNEVVAATGTDPVLAQPAELG